ncbi:putative tetratricopeptide-like helical domain superfamily [Helianthus annuus]|nr:putative tetratricopeptide-like helical domain superfamily [Helianthus annuus]
MQTLRNFLRHPTISILETCKTLKQINQFHSQLLVNGFLNHPDLLSKFAASIALKHPTNIEYAVQLLDPSHNPTVFALNSLIRVYSKSSTPEYTFRFYNSILLSNQKPDNYTFTFLIKSCAQFKDLSLGLAVHATVLKYGFHQDPHIQSGLINMYAEMELLGHLKDLFLDINQPDLVTQTAMLVACARLGDIAFARQLFDKMPDRDVIAWNAMIAGYVQCGEPLKGLELFYVMETNGLKVNEGSMVSVLSACTRLGALDTGRWAHEYIERKKLKIDVTLGSALVDMYAKCGDINMAMEVFWGMKEKNVYTWSCAMGGLAMNGYGDKCVELYRRMRHEDVMPNEVTFTSVLKGCSVAGFVEEGCKLFESMKNEFGMERQLEHYGCMVDLYGLSGRLDEALNFIYSMPIRPHAGAWGALLKACKLYNNVEIAELASRKMVELEGNKDGAYVQLSNIYADFNKWDSVHFVRHKMKSKRVAKVPGVSVIPWP